MIKKTICIMFLAASFLTVAEAKEKHGHAPHDKSAHFEEMDANKDGKVSKEEWASHFGSVDTNSDGFIDKSEWQAHHKALHAKE